jgi:hypothetical protein
VGDNLGSVSRLGHEALVRLLAADLVGEHAVLASLVGPREDIAELSAQIDIAAADADKLPHRRTYLLLTHRLARRLLEVHLEWLDEVERELGQPTAAREPG